MIEEKYYTPSIEDIRVGYECEMYSGYDSVAGFPVGSEKEKPEYWSKKVLDRDTLADDHEGEGFWMIGWELDNKRLRTSYLTKEQIKGEGWGSYDKGFSHNKEVDGEGYHIWYSEYSNFLSIEKGKSPFRKVLFLGKCPSINEFRYISKLLGI